MKEFKEEKKQIKILLDQNSTKWVLLLLLNKRKLKEDAFFWSSVVINEGFLSKH